MIEKLIQLVSSERAVTSAEALWEMKTGIMLLLATVSNTDVTVAVMPESRCLAILNSCSTENVHSVKKHVL